MSRWTAEPRRGFRGAGPGRVAIVRPGDGGSDEWSDPGCEHVLGEPEARHLAEAILAACDACRPGACDGCRWLGPRRDLVACNHPDPSEDGPVPAWRRDRDDNDFDGRLCPGRDDVPEQGEEGER